VDVSNHISNETKHVSHVIHKVSNIPHDVSEVKDHHVFYVSKIQVSDI